MNLFNADKVMSRLDAMIENAMEGRSIESGFDETKMSALETKLSHYLAMTQTARAQLEDDKARINVLISDISHQVKTPIANLLLYSQLLEESDLSKEDKRCVELLIEQTQKLNFLIASLVKASRLESGIIAVSPKLQGVQPLLENVSDQIMAKADAKSIAFAVVPTQAEAVFDMKWTSEAICNIADNAVKYTPCGGSVTLSVLPYQLFCRIDIQDTVMGICEGESSKIFARFYRSPAACEEEGVGIGLFLAREIITCQGGYIKVSSKSGQGSVFSVFLRACLESIGR